MSDIAVMTDNKHSNITMTIKNMNIVGSWQYDVENKECSLCNHDLTIPSKISIMQNKINGTVIIGACKHGFHENCINQWLGSDNISCPICKNVWNTTKNVGGTIYLYKNP